MTSADILRELRAARPVAPEALRARVESIAATPIERRPSFGGRLLARRRSLLVVVPTAAALAVASAGVIGIAESERPATVAAERDSTTLRAAQPHKAGATEKAGSESDTAAPPWAIAGGSAGAATTPGPTTGRAQRVVANLTIEVADTDALSRATQRALDTARSLGGYVVNVSYAAAEEGNATLTLRVPTARVQDAITRLSSLGTILAQQVQIDDLQESIDALGRRIANLRERIARISAQLADPNLDAETRATLEARRRAARDELAALRADRAAQTAEARLATIQLALVTEQGSVVPGVPSRFDQALDRMAEILAWEGIVVLYALVLVGPFALVAIAALFGHRALRRRENERLLGAS